jgi:S1-C subfamily serine protease
VPLVVLLALAGAVLVWLLVPGTRLFPDRAPQAVAAEEAARVAEAVNASLTERRAALRAALDGAQCRADGTLVLPGGRTLEGLLPPRPGAPDAAPGSRTEADPAPALPAPGDRVVVADGPDAPATTLISVIEDRTAMVLVRLAAGGLSTGSGFFIAPDLFVTNHHVIAGADPARIFVASRALGRARPAELVASRGPFDAVGTDFALLRVPGADQPFYPVLQPQGTLKLTGVIAAGYPGDVLQGDADFAALAQGNGASVPDLTVTDGLVNTEQALPGRSSLIVHSAPISRGNSGGPLVDLCGRVVGVNTFVRQGPMRNLNFALSGADLLAFLADAGAQPAVETAACQPVVLRPVPPPLAAPDDNTAPAAQP